MDQSGKLRSRSPAFAEDRELLFPPPGSVADPILESLLPELLKQYDEAFGCERSADPYSLREVQLPLPIPAIVAKHKRIDARSFSEIRDLAFELILYRLSQQQSHDAFRTETPASLDQAEEPEDSLLIPSTLMPTRTPESRNGDAELFGRGRDLILVSLTVLAVGFAIILGLLLGLHIARNRISARVPRHNESARSLSAVSTESNSLSTTADSGRGNSAQLANGSHHVESRVPHRKTSARPQTPGGLTIYKNDQVIFHLSPEQGGMTELKRPD